MIQVESQLKIVDNSGGKWAKCILVVLKKISNQKKVKKRTKYIGLIVGEICSWRKY